LWESKNYESGCSWNSQSHISDTSWLVVHWILEGSGTSRGTAEQRRGTLPWVVRTEGKERLLVGTVARIINCKILMYGFWAKVPMYLCFFGWSAYVFMIFGPECLCIYVWDWNDCVILGQRAYMLTRGQRARHCIFMCVHL
jgi:hypothetical protein